jgi:hypothetical protein
VHALCETCVVLTDAFEDLTDKLLDATSRMADIAGTRNHESFEVARLEVEHLRSECENSRDELKRHRAEHGC